MGYVGNQTTTAFTSMDKQDITGNGGTSYTLSHAVANAQEIEVFVNNVRQEPAVAYTATGTALTMTGAVASTDDFYVVYQGKAVQTVVPPDGSVTSAKLDTNIAIAGTLSTVGTVGIGTTTPSSYNGGADDLVLATTGSTGITIASGTSNNGSLFFADGTSGADQYRGYVQYEQTNNAMAFGTNGAERLRIDTNGVLLNGKTSSAFGNVGQEFHQDGVGLFTRSLSNGDSGATAYFRRNTSEGNVVLFYKDGTNVGSISVTGSSTAYNTSSDARLKENVTYDWDATTRLKQLKPARFNFIADADTTVDGFLAHEAQAVVPEAVTGTKDAMRDEEYEITPAVLDDDGNEVTPAEMGTRSVPDYQGIDQAKLVPLLTKALIESVEKIEQLEARITALEAE